MKASNYLLILKNHCLFSSGFHSLLSLLGPMQSGFWLLHVPKTC